MQLKDRDIKELGRSSLNKGKRGVKHIIFGRTGVLLLCFLVQGLLLFAGLNFLAQYVYLFFGGYLIFGLLVLMLILNRMENPAFQLAWTTLVLLFPLFGGLLYLYLDLQPGTTMIEKRLKEIEQDTEGLIGQDPELLVELSEKDCRTAQLANYMNKDGYPVFKNTKIKYFRSGEEKFQELLNQLRKAEKFIFLEYFIISEGYMWDRILDVLKEKVREGVEVRLMYDGTDEVFNNLPHEYPKYLAEFGIRCKIFFPVYPVISTYYNNRDHRKIVVIDGHTAFTGGVNLADEYINRKERFGKWKDAAIMLQGDAVDSFTVMFLKLWAVSEKKTEDMKPYLRAPGAAVTGVQADPDCRTKDRTQTYELLAENADGYVIPYGDNPFIGEHLGERVYVDILNSATRYVHIMTPYLVPDHEMLQALCYAAKRGVDVKLILPHIPDKKYAFALAHAYYKRLMRAGVRIYEYTPGFVHSKVFVSDDVSAVVGTINLDYRSLFLHFECAAFLYQVPEIARIEGDFTSTLPQCQLMTPFDVKHDKWGRKVVGQLMRLVAPLI